MPKVNPEILVWARETAGLTPEAAVRKLSIRDTQKANALDRLAGYESGAEDPSRPLLLRMSKQYRRPLVAFYLPKPPTMGDRGADFRTLSGDDHTPETDAILDTLLRNIRARQSMVRALLEDEEETAPLPFVGSRTMADGQAAVLNALQALLKVRLADYRSQPDAGAAFDFLRRRAEEEGIFVLLKSDLGSHHTAVEMEIFRGFSISDNIAPFIVINERDARAAWTFTLLHEIVHLILGQTGVSGRQAENETERFCDDVAGDFLLPEREISELDLRGAKEIGTIAERITEFAGIRKLSRAMVAYRAHLAGAIAPAQFQEISDKFREEWRQEVVARRAQRQSQEGGPSYYVVRQHRLGHRLTSLVGRMVAAGELSTSKAARILDVRPTQVQPILERTSRWQIISNYFICWMQMSP